MLYLVACRADGDRFFMDNSKELIHEVLPVGWLQCNCSVIGDPVTREAIVVDPGDDVTRILEVLSKHNLTVKHIVITHGHIDHVGGAAKLKKVTGAPVLMNPEDRWLLENLEVQASFIGMPPPATPNIESLIFSRSIFSPSLIDSTAVAMLQPHLLHLAGRVALTRDNRGPKPPSHCRPIVGNATKTLPVRGSSYHILYQQYGRSDSS